MEVWHVLICGATCAGGAIVFLRLVTDGVAAASAALDRVEARERRAREKSKGQDSGPVAIGVLAA